MVLDTEMSEMRKCGSCNPYKANYCFKVGALLNFLQKYVDNLMTSIISYYDSIMITNWPNIREVER